MECMECEMRNQNSTIGVKRLIKTAAVLLLAAAAFFAMAPQAGAADAIDVSKTGSMTLTPKLAEDDGSVSYDIFQGANVSIYRVASIDENGSPTLLSPYTSSGVELTTDVSTWPTIASTLDGWVTSNNITATDSGTYGSDVSVKFSNLKTGIYLVTGEPVAADDGTYTPVASLVSIPTTNENGTNLYDVSSNVKYSFYKPEYGDKKYTVVKHWKNDGDGTSRPASIKVKILQDGKTYKTVTLSKKNNWKYTWTGSTESTWKVVEHKVPKGYSVTVTPQQERNGLHRYQQIQKNKSTHTEP